MRLLYVDPFGGAAGDMLLASLIELLGESAGVERTLAGLRLPGWRLETRRDRQQGFAGRRLDVVVEQESHPARHLADVERLLAGAELPERVRERALRAFRRLFEAEAGVHGVPLDKAHLHEIAAVDAVIDIVGTCAAAELLAVDRIECGPVPVGSGTVETAHGLLPVPPPAVAELLRGVPIAGHAAPGEMTTPTGAVLVTTLAERFGPLPAGRLLAVGVGLGTRVTPGVPNLLRAMLLEVPDRSMAARPMALIETTIDDATGEALGFLIERVREAGALDAWCLPATGRKGRPVNELRAVCPHETVGSVSAALFTEGATLGVRVLDCLRPELERLVLDVETGFGSIAVKLGVFEGRIVSAKPERADCEQAARAAGVSVAAVEHAARVAAPPIGSPPPSHP